MALAAPVLGELAWLCAQGRAPRLRTMREFAEQEIVIPNGPFEGSLYRADRQPYAVLWFEELERGNWNRFFATGPTQSGKTLTCFVIPTLYHLFEIGEAVICGLPNLDMAGDKWREDFLPVIYRSRYRELLPTKGAGSRGGRVDAITFKNGATLKFMSGGSGDKGRAGYTARVVVLTEIDGMDEAGHQSREADKITQMEARTRAFGDRKRIYGECTVSIEEGRTWQEYQAGSASRIFVRCPLCGVFVSPEREHLQGWQGAEDLLAAQERGRFVCPACSEPWDEDARRDAVAEAVLAHGTQTVSSAGEVDGEWPRTRTLGFRWSAVHNLFQRAGDLAGEEWRAAQRAEERGEDLDENSERELCQFVWAVPYVPLEQQGTQLDARGIMVREAVSPMGLVPADAEWLTVGCDVQQRLGYWVLLARCPTRFVVVDYGVAEFPSDQLGVEEGILTGLRNWRDEVVHGGWQGVDGEVHVPEFTLVDSGWMSSVVYQFCRESNTEQTRWFPVKGHSAVQSVGRLGRYREPDRKQTAAVLAAGDHWHITSQEVHGTHLLHVDVDHWKLWVHSRLRMPMDEPGALVLAAASDVRQHHTFAKHLVAERWLEEFVAGKGMIGRWEVVSRNNHWLDAQTYAGCAMDIEERRAKAAQQGRGRGGSGKRVSRATLADGRPYFVGERR